MAKEYTVKHVAERVRLTKEGELEKIYHVVAKTAGDIPFTMDLTEEEREPEKAKELLAAKAMSLDSLLAL